MSRILQLLQLRASAESVDYVQNKTQFHLFTLPTEQRHEKTWNLSATVAANAEAGLRMLLSVDDDVVRKMEELACNPTLLEQAVRAVVHAIAANRKIYVYGCGATGRLAKQMESSLWRPFWRNVKSRPIWSRLRPHLPGDIESRLIGEMTGGDRALVSSLEGFEDLQLIGKLQLEDRGISKGDVVFCITEGGETSSVIGTILAALAQYGELSDARRDEARARLYFIYNNPNDALRAFERSRSVLDNPAITKLCLATGPQAITGSTRLQATTSETFALGVVLEEAIYRILSPHLTQPELDSLGYRGTLTLGDRLMSFRKLKTAVDAATASLANLTQLEADTYRHGRFSTYFARAASVTVFIDCAERSPTFRLYPLDKVDESERRSWVQVWTAASDGAGAWQAFLGRPFRGLERAFYREPFEQQTEDLYLRQASLASLDNAGSDQETLYDFSFSDSNIERRGPQAGDLGVLVLLDEELPELEKADSSFSRFAELFCAKNAKLALVVVTQSAAHAITRCKSAPQVSELLVQVNLDSENDPLALRQQVALKMLINAHSTAVMAALGRVVGNTMTSVSPSNLKLIGRATHLILSHVNDTLQQPEWLAEHGPCQPLSFAAANAVLWDAVAHVRARQMGQTPEVGLCIIRILEALGRRADVSWDEARRILEQESLAGYLSRRNPSLAV